MKPDYDPETGWEPFVPTDYVVPGGLGAAYIFSDRVKRGQKIPFGFQAPSPPEKK